MTEPVVYLDRSEILEGQLEAVRGAIGELARFVEANEPQILGYVVYFDEDGNHMNVIHVHRDSRSLQTHIEVAGAKFAPFASLIRLLSIDVYGHPDEAVVENLRRKASMLGGAVVRVHPFVTGFVR